LDEAGADAHSRLTAIRLSLMMLRYMEHWRVRVGDYDAIMILVAIGAIVAERVTRDNDLTPDLKSLRQPFPRERLTPCNVSSIASATGLNRETTRRKVKELADLGVLVRNDGGGIGFAPGILQQVETQDMFRRQLDCIVKLTNELLRDGTLKVN
jgi:hypothetical protein